MGAPTAFPEKVPSGSNPGNESTDGRWGRQGGMRTAQLTGVLLVLTLRRCGLAGGGRRGVPHVARATTRGRLGAGVTVLLLKSLPPQLDYGSPSC